MADSESLECWLTSNNLSSLLEMLLEYDIFELTDLTENLEDEVAIDEFIEELNIPSTAQQPFKNALLVLCNLNDTNTFNNEDIKEMDKYDAAPQDNNEPQSESKIEDSDDDCYQEAFIDPSNKERLKAIWNSDNAKTDIINCIGSLRIEYDDKKLTNREFCHGSATVIDIDKNNCCCVLTAAHNGYQLLRECSECNKRTIETYCTTCRIKCKRIKPLELIKATSITFSRRCIKKKQIDTNTGEERIFGDPISSYHINNYIIYKSLYTQNATAKSGYDICIMTFDCRDINDATMYRRICGNIQLQPDATFGSQFKARLNVFGYPGKKGYIEQNSQQMMYQMYGMSTGVDGNHMKVETHNMTKKKYVVNSEIDTQPGMSGSAIWTIHGIFQPKFIIYAVHTGGKQAINYGVNYGTFLDECHIKWIENIKYKLLLKDGSNIVPSTKREYLISKLKADEYEYKGGDGFNKETFLIKTTIRGLNDDEKNAEEKNETRKPEKLFADAKHKIILLCGKTGSGKTTLINSMMNYIYNIQQDDRCRMKLIIENQQNRDNSKSQTDHISSYTIQNPHNGNIDYGLTIIDTPGFGDNRGIDKDKQTVEEFRYVFEKIIANINAICFIVKSPDSRLDATQTYVFNNMLNLWGKDVVENIFILMTYADGGEPSCNDALNKIDVLKNCQNRLKMNNSAFSVDKDINSNKFQDVFWKMGMQCFEDFFNKLDSVEPKPITQSIQVLLKREQIQTKLFHVKEQFDIALTKQNQISEKEKFIELQRKKLDEGKEVVWWENKIYYEEQKVDQWDKWNHHVLSCKKHNTTCHQCYNIKGFWNTVIRTFGGKTSCIMIDSNHYCTCCGCHYSKHVQNIEYVKKTKSIKRSSWNFKNEQKNEYYEAKECLSITETILETFKQEKQQNIEKIENMLPVIQKLQIELEKIALRPQLTTFGEYIDKLIENETNQEKKQTLQELKKKEKWIEEKFQKQNNASLNVLGLF